MTALQKYIDQKNRWNSIFKGKQYEIQTAEGRQEIANCLDSDLSPENLTCDGELSRSQVNVRFNSLTKAAKELKKLEGASSRWRDPPDLLLLSQRFCCAHSRYRGGRSGTSADKGNAKASY